VLTDGRRHDQLKSNLLGVHSKIVQTFWCLSANFLTTLSDGDVSRWKLYIAWCQGMFLSWLALCFSRTELNAPLPPLAAHVATPDGAHQESMCKTDQPPCQLMRPRRINNIIGSKLTLILVCIGFRMTNILSCIWYRGQHLA